MSFNDWGGSYSAISFAERALGGNDKVASFVRTKDILFTITHINGETIYMLLVDEYCLGLAAIHRARNEFPEADYIVTCANWNGYTREAKEYGDENNLGIFNIGEFFGALNWTNPKTYYQKDRDGNRIYAYKVA